MAVPRSPGIWLATLTGTLFGLFGSALFATLAILTSWIPPRGSGMFHCARLWAHGLLFCSGVRLRVGREPGVDPARRYVFMPNHQGLFDIPVLLATLPGQTRFMAKASLFRIPVFGWALSAGGFVPVERGDRSRARDAFFAAAQRLREGTSLLVFPEETRSLDGRLLPFKRGGFLLAAKGEAPIVPVGIDGTLNVRRRGGWWIRPGVVRVCYGTPVPVSGRSSEERASELSQVREAVRSLAGLPPDP